ncbi:hypothetical protein EZS27_018594 [termite gut metagenome]|uniref:IS1 family transposase n=1 Tax=termite gut metagenome TaxID=433724 RepID=A0A5J4RIQ8_9ZZZZ
MTLNGSGVGDIGRVLKISRDTAVAVLKKTLSINPCFITRQEQQMLDCLDVEIVFSGETDEFWSFAGNKGNQRWRWYAIERRSGCIPAWHNGKRTDRDFLRLWNSLKIFDMAQYHTDDWGAHSKYIPPDKLRVGKDKTWKIERKNLNFRTHLKRLNRKTICFSKNETVHDNVTGVYIERYYYKNGTYGNYAFS